MGCFFMSLCGTDQDKERLIKRLSRVEGQVKGLQKMIANDDNCIDVLRQITSASGALRGVWTQVVGDHIRGCVQRGINDNDNSEELIQQLLDHLTKIK